MSRSKDFLAITFAEFDNHAGPQLRYSYPPDIITKEAFEPVSDYVILGKHLCERVITIKLEKWQLLSYPIAIENTKYERNTLSFSFGFVLSHGAKSAEYGKVLKNIGSFFQDIEIERGFISGKETNTQLPRIMENIYTDLITKAFSFLPICTEPPSFLSIKLFRNPVFPRLIEDHEVPMFRQDRIALNQLPWDISFQHLILHIDGINHVRRIVEDADMDMGFVKRSLALLEYYGAIVVSDIFRFSNVYKLNGDSGMSNLMDASIIADMTDFAFTPDISRGRQEGPPSPRNLINFLLKLQPGVTVGQALLSFASIQQQPPPNFLRNLDISRLIAFAQVSGIIKRVHEFPIYISNAQYKVYHPHHSTTGMDSLMQTPRQRFDSDGSLVDQASLAAQDEYRNSNHGEDDEENDDEFGDHPQTADSDLMVTACRVETTEPLAGDDKSVNNRNFSKLTHRTKPVVGRSYLKESFVDNIVQQMNGSECLDAYCCRYEVGFLDIIHHPNIQIVYK